MLQEKGTDEVYLHLQKQLILYLWRSAATGYSFKSSTLSIIENNKKYTIKDWKRANLRCIQTRDTHRASRVCSTPSAEGKMDI